MMPGDLQVIFKPGPTFTDWQYLVGDTIPAKGQFPVCVYCAAVMGGDFLKRHQAKYNSAIYSAEGAWAITKDGERKAFLLSPPEPPFVAYVATTMGQHVVWRTPITLDKDWLQVGFGRDILTIERPLLLAASSCCEAVMDALRDSDYFTGRKKIKAGVRHPFVELNRKGIGECGQQGVLRGDYRAWLVRNGFAADVALLESLGPGELWGLSVLNKQKIEEPVWTPIA